MFRPWSGWIALCAGVSLVVLGSAREEKPREPVFVISNANTDIYVSLKPSAMLNDPLGKQTLGTLPRDLPFMQVLERDLQLAPIPLKRAIYVHKRGARDARVVVFLEGDKPLATKDILSRMLTRAKPETKRIHGVNLLTHEEKAAYISADEKRMVIGPIEDLERMLDPEAKKPTGLLAEVIAKAETEHLAGYVLPTAPPHAPNVLWAPRWWSLTQPLLAAKEVGGWMSIGYETRAAGEARYADEAAARRGCKRLIAEVTIVEELISRAGDKLARKSKSLGAFMHKLEKVLENTPVEQESTRVTANLTLKLDKEEVDTLVKAVISTSQTPAARTSTNNLKRLGIAMQGYHDANGTFPARASFDRAGKALLSWRVHILPYLDQEALYKEFKLDEPWDSPHNKKLLTKMPDVYKIPNFGTDIEGGTFYQVFTGKSTVFDNDSGRKLASITDGAANTLMVVEAAKEVPWTKPEDLPFDAEAKQLPKLGGHFESGFHALLCDGSVRLLKHTIDIKTLKALITPDGGEVIGKID